MTLHTKYRPTSIGKVIGHEAVKKSFAAAIATGSSQTFLLYGPSGTGKTTLARIAARDFGSKEKDILEIDAATYTGIDDMRTVTSGLMYKPFGVNAVKTIIIDECHRLSAPSWASLLKALEEPPPWVYWFLCTTELGKVPANIKTRCTSYELKPVPTAQIYDLLVAIAKKEKIFPNTKAGKGEGIMELCAIEAQGSPRQALVNLGLCIDIATRKEAAELLRSAVDSSEAIELAQALLKGVGWPQVQTILETLKETNAESVRHVVRAYMTSVALKATKESVAGRALEVLDAFSQPFYSGDGLSPVLLACGKVVLG